MSRALSSSCAVEITCWSDAGRFATARSTPTGAVVGVGEWAGAPNEPALEFPPAGRLAAVDFSLLLPHAASVSGPTPANSTRPTIRVRRVLIGTSPSVANLTGGGAAWFP